MFTKYTRIVYTSIFLCLVLLTSCTNSPSSITQTPTPTRKVATSPTAAPALTVSNTPDTTPAHYNARVVLSGRERPDDLAFDTQGHLLFSDFYHGTISRLNADGSVTVLIAGLAGSGRGKVVSKRARSISEAPHN